MKWYLDETEPYIAKHYAEMLKKLSKDETYSLLAILKDRRKKLKELDEQLPEKINELNMQYSAASIQETDVSHLMTEATKEDRERFKSLYGYTYTSPLKIPPEKISLQN